MAETEVELTTAQKIAKMQAAGYVPEQAAVTSPELTTAQKIAKMQAAGYVPTPEEPGIMDRNLNPLSGVPLIGGGDVSANDMIHGAINELPLAGGMVGGAIGGGIGAAGGLGTGGAVSVPLALAGGAVSAGIGGALGSAAKDALNSFLYGKQKPLVDSFRDAAVSGGKMALGTGAGEAALLGIGVAGKAALATDAGSQVGSLISGVSSPLIKAYADGAARIKAAFSSESTFRMGQAAKQQYITDLQATRKVLNDQIGAELAGNNTLVDAQPILKALSDAKAKLNPALSEDAMQIAKIQQRIDEVSNVAGEDGKLSLPEAHQLKTTMQDAADAAGAYGKPGKAYAGTQSGFADKTAAGVANQLVSDVAPNTIAKPLKQLSTLHNIEDNMNAAILNPRKSSGPLISAGKAESAVGEKHLGDLEDMQAITGTNMVQPAQDIAAAQALGKYKFSPSLKGLGQPAVKAAIDASTAMGSGQAARVGSTLGQSVMHGSGAMDSLRQSGPQQ